MDPRTRNRVFAALGVVDRHLPGGHDQDTHAGLVGAVKDALKLAGKLDLETDEQFLGSGKIAGDFGTVRLALVDRKGSRSLRLGLGGPGFGGRDDDAGPWLGGPDRTEKINADRRRLRDEQASIEAELARLAADPNADAGRTSALTARLDELDDLDTVDVTPAGYTARLDQSSMDQLQSTLTQALDDGARAQAAANAYWDERERLEAARDKLRGMGRKWTDAEEAQWDSLTAQLEALSEPADYEVFAEGSIAAEWADVHYLVDLDDLAIGVRVHLGAVPHGSGRDLSDLYDHGQSATLEPGEARKLLRLLSTYTQESRRSRIAERHLGPLHDQKTHGGIDIPGFNPGDYLDAWTTEGSFGVLAMGLDHSGDVRLNIPGSGDSRHDVDMGSDDFAALVDALDTLATQRDDIPDGTPANRLVSSAVVTDGVEVDLYGSGVIAVTWDADGDDPITLSLDPPYEEDDEEVDDVAALIEAGEAILDTAEAEELRYDQPHEPKSGTGAKPTSRIRRRPTPTKAKTLPAKATKRRSTSLDVCLRAFDFESRSAGDGRTLEGYAAVFGKPARISDLKGDFEETITRGAFTRSLQSRTPVLQFEHGKDPRVGAVPIGVFEEIEEDGHGLRVRARLFDNDLVEPVRQAIAGKAIKGMSFRFTVPEGGDSWTRSAGGEYREIRDADIYEAGPVVFPAYDATTVSVRSILASLDVAQRRALARELVDELRQAVDLTTLDDVEDEEPEDRPTDFVGRSTQGVDGDEPDTAAVRGAVSPPSEDTSTRAGSLRELDDRVLRALGVISG